MQFRLHRVGATEHVTVDVIGGRQRIKADFVQHLVSRFDVPFQDTVKLEGLAVGQTDAAVQGVFFGKFVDAKPLLRRHDAARKRQRSIIAWRGSSFCSARSARISRSSC